jgi:hypothetical protein
MPTYETSASIAAQPKAVWSVLADVANWHRWTPTVLKVEALSSAELRVGNRFKIYQPRLRPAIWTVTAVEAPTRFAWESRVPGVVMIADHTLDAISDRTSRLTLRFAFRGLLGAIVGPMSRKLVESYMAQEAASLRNYLAADSHGQQGLVCASLR